MAEVDTFCLKDVLTKISLILSCAYIHICTHI